MFRLFRDATRYVNGTHVKVSLTMQLSVHYLMFILEEVCSLVCF